jgi:hypothetical protein
MGFCKFCNKEFESKRLGGHTVLCSKNPKFFLIREKAKYTHRLNILLKNPIIEKDKVCIRCGKNFKIKTRKFLKNKEKEQKCCSKICAKANNIKNLDTFNRINICKGCGKKLEKKRDFCDNICHLRYTQRKIGIDYWKDLNR